MGEQSRNMRVVLQKTYKRLVAKTSIVNIYKKKRGEKGQENVGYHMSPCFRIIGLHNTFIKPVDYGNKTH